MTRFKRLGIIPILILFNFMFVVPDESKANGMKIPPGIAYPPSLPGHGSMKKYEFFGDPTMTLKYKLPPKSDDLVEMAYQFFELNKDIFHMKDPRTELKFEGAGGSRFKGKDLGSQVTFWQVYKGIGGLSRISLLFTPEGDIKYMQGAFYYDITVPTTPKIDSTTAEKIAVQNVTNGVNIRVVKNKEHSTGLRIWKHEINGNYYLVWKVWIHQERPVHFWEYFIDAMNGEILYRLDNIMRDKIRLQWLDKQNKGDSKLPTEESEHQSSFQKIPSVDTLKIPKSILMTHSKDNSLRVKFKPAEASDFLYWETIMTEDFEGVFPSANWYVFDNDGTTNGEYYWDDVSYTSHGGFYSAWCAAGGANGLDPATSNYANNMKSWMVFGPFSLCDSDTSILTFWHSTVTEVNKDFLSVKASIDGQIFYGWDGSGNTQGWIPDYLDLNNKPLPIVKTKNRHF